MKRKKIIAGNWKLNMNQAQTRDFLKEVSGKLSADDLNAIEAIVCPPFTSIAAAGETIKEANLKIAVGAQNLSQHQSGAYTGEINAEMLKELGISSVLVGHSERRETFAEDDSVIKAKLNTGLEAGLNVILCCGESEATREVGDTDKWVAGQIASALEGLSLTDFASRVTIAYEPIWAIGTGKVCDSAEANRVCAMIRSKLAEILDQASADATRILYGGSVKSSNVDEIIAQSDIDGALVGGASIKVEEFPALVASAARESAKAVA
ncbi:MAG: triose-phosphate isomerase [Candidatus Melainabacteria bacterium]|nr:triose-phosphate isomerase [Candidatus Melainabacteria bacterium]